MANWAYIENGQVVETHNSLPTCWRNISNFYVLQNDIEYLKSIDWFPITHPSYSYDPETQQLDNRRYTFDGVTVTEEWQIIDKIKPPPLSIDDIEKMLIQETQNRLDMFARTKGYDGILSACSYSTDPHPIFRSEGMYCVEMRSQTWISLHQILKDIRDGDRAIPKIFNDIANELPILNWPE